MRVDIALFLVFLYCGMVLFSRIMGFCWRTSLIVVAPMVVSLITFELGMYIIQYILGSIKIMHRTRNQMESIFYYDPGDPWSNRKLGPSYGTLFRKVYEEDGVYIVPVDYESIEISGSIRDIAIEDEFHYKMDLRMGRKRQWTHRLK